MLKRLLIPALAIALIWTPSLEAQTGSLAGSVVDSFTDNPLAGAFIRIEDLGRSAISNANGEFAFADLPAGTHAVRVTYIGYRPAEQSVTIAAGENTADFRLEQDVIGLDQIVVTGQQIERQAREVAYSLSTVRGDDLIRARETNFVSALAGRTPGVEVTSQSGNLGASTRIVIRGISSLSGDNQPLFVVDGVPISNANVVANTSQDRLTGAIDVGNRAADLNPDDIESVTVLRGAAAAALYGQRARDGVILVQTRRGIDIPGQTITANSTIRFGQPLVLPDFQNEFAQGTAGAYQATSLNGWGPRIAGQEVENIFGEPVTLTAQPSNVRDFYRSTATSINSFSFSSGDERGDFRLGITRQDERGIVPNSDQGRTSVTLNSGYTVSPRVRARISGTYSNLNSVGRAVQGGNDPNVLTTIVNGLPRTMSTADLRNYQREDGTQRSLGTFTNNPYFVANENPFSQEVERGFGNTSVAFDPVDWITVTGRGGIDFYTETRQNVNVVGTLGREDGLFSRDVIQERQLDFDLLGEARRDLNDDFGLRAVAGLNINSLERQIQRNQASELEVPGLLNFANALTNVPGNSSSRRRLMGVYGDATIDFRDYVFLNVTGRNDWSTTLPEANNSFFYPSVNLSVVLTDAIDIPLEALSYVKLRANWAEVGSDEAPHQLDFRFFPVSDIFGQFGTGNTFPYGGRSGFNATSTIPPEDLRPQNQRSFEVGGEIQFFEGRAGLDLTFYDVLTEDQIISIPIPPSTGFSFNRTNIGEVQNRGIEVAVNLVPIRTPAFLWDLGVNFTRNTNEVVSLAPGVDEIVIQSGFNALQVRAEPGESLGLYGPGFQRDPTTGLPIIDSATGLRQEGETVRLGQIDPSFRLTLNNSASYRNLNLSAMVDWRQGGVLFSQTVGSLRRGGLAEETLANRDGTFIDEGVIVVARDPDTDEIIETRPNDVPVQNMQAFWGRYASASIHEGNVFSATNVRLREVTLSYTLPREWLQNLPVGSAMIGFEARNLFLLYKRIPHIDPETGLFGSASNGQGIEWNVLPATRSFGANIQLRF